ncbi:MAG: S8 family serine peptidase [Gammaproteobacteria bacterium]|nr:S8 family serine peptidase [Gammaproteobacteria bacterium]
MLPIPRCNPATLAGSCRFGAVAGFVLALLFSLNLAFAQAPDARGGDRAERWVPGQVLVKPKPGLSDERLERILARHDGRTVGRIPQIDVRIIQVPEHAVERVAAALARNPNIKFAEPDYLREPAYVEPNDPRFGNAWHLGRIRSPEAWSVSQGDGVIVAILDTGIHASHPDFQNKLVKGWNSASQNDDITDVHGHGTQVAGTVGAATDNATGVAAVGWDARIMPIRVTDRSDGAASSSNMARGLTWAADNGAHIANMSYQSWRDSVVVSAAQYMRDRGGVVFGAAGNGGTDTGAKPNPYVVVVSATNSSDSRTSWSNYGEYVDLAAPGASIQTTSGSSSYTSASGTSFSSPVTAAVAALVKAANPALTPDQVEQILYSTAVDLGAAGWDPYFGWGRVDAAAAVAAAWTADVDTEAPAVGFASPKDGATVGGDVHISVEAKDNVGVTRVVVFANGRELGSESVAPYEFVWDTTLEADGKADLLAEAYDAAGNVGRIAIRVTIEQPTVPEPDPALDDSSPAPAPAPVDDDEPPVVAFISPSDGEVVSGNVRIEAAASDNVGVVAMALFVDGNQLCTSTSDSIRCSWHTRRVADGKYVISAEATDAAGNVGVDSIVVQIGGSSGDGGGGPPPGRGNNR